MCAIARFEQDDVTLRYALMLLMMLEVRRCYAITDISPSRFSPR